MRKFTGFLPPTRSASGNPLFAGIALGILLGLCLSLLLDDNDIDDYFALFQAQLPAPFFTHLPIQLRHKLPKKQFSPEPPFLRCVVLLESGDGFKPEKEFVAIRNTWARECNETLFFTDSVVLHRRYVDELPDSTRILLVHGNLSPSLREWKIVRNILHFLATSNNKMVKNDEKWTILSDVKSYVHTRNLRDLLTTVEEGIPIILGRKQQQKSTFGSIFANLLPSASSKYPLAATISTDAPMVFSQRAFRVVTKACWNLEKKESSWWWPTEWLPFLGGIPRHTGRAIGGCALRMGVALWDPVDEEAHPLIVTENLRNLFSNNMAKTNATENNQNVSHVADPQIAKCCSDKTIAFGLLNHKDQRLIDFGVHQLKVFGTFRG